MSDLAGLPPWLVEESYHAVGDAAETIALLLPEGGASCPLPLHQVVATYIQPLRHFAGFQLPTLREAWEGMSTPQRLLFNKLITGAFRVGVSRTLVTRALAQVADLEPAIMAHRLMGTWQPTAETYARLLASEDAASDPARPYPFFLASPTEDPSTDLGDPAAFLAEWKWDGIRAQLIKRQGQVLLWSRQEEPLGESFPELAQAAAHLPNGTVLDGEVLAWREGGPLPFAQLQRRLGRKKVPAAVLREVPVTFLAYDCLESSAADLRSEPLEIRRKRLATLLAALPAGLPLRIGEQLALGDWSEAAALRATARQRRVEGLMLKRRGSPYRSGRPRGDWWKWKVAPYTLDTVMVYAQVGHGRRASLYTDYTFAVWKGDQLVPIAKAYSGLDDDEIRRVDAFIRNHTLAKRGPVRMVEPKLVFELAFEGIQRSTRHKSGLSLRFPRIHRWRHDKPPSEADTLAAAENLLASAESPTEPLT